ncbi:MAG TPA: hypothetical protein VII13_04910 [Vicinamibacteria bacterium]|jgi:hypothetical protein
MNLRPLWLLLLGASWPGTGLAQTNDRLFQDESGFGPSNLIQGSGARAWGMGGAFLARADDGTAISWNPAGLSYLRRPEVSLVGVWSSDDSVEDRNVEVAGATLRVRETDLARGQWPDFAAVALPFELGGLTGSVQVSFQRLLSFTQDRTIERARARDIRIEIDSSGGFDAVSLGAGVHLGRGVRLGASLNRWVDGHAQRLVRFVERRGEQTLDFGISGWNVNLGVIVSPTESLNIGAVLKTPFDASVAMQRYRVDRFSTGDDESTDIVSLNSWRSDAVVVEMPGALGLGVSWRPRSTLTLSADYTRTNWSEGRILNFFTLAPSPPEGPPPRPPESGDTYPVLPYPSLQGEQADTVQFRGGAEYVFRTGGLLLPVRVGAFTDRQHFRPGEDDVRREAPVFYGFTAGTGVIVGPLLFDVAYVYEKGDYGDPQGDSTRVRDERVFASVIFRSGGQP